MSNPLDASLRKIMAITEMSKTLLEQSLESTWCEVLDFDQTELLNGKFLKNNKVKASVCELIFRIPIAESGNPVYIYMCMTYPGCKMPNSLQSAMHRACLAAEAFYKDKETKRPATVIPLVVHTGPREE